MPVYCYKREDNGQIEDVFMSIAQMLERQNGTQTIMLDDGVKGARDYAAQNTQTSDPGCWPMESDSLNVGSDQIGAYSKFSKHHGVPTEYTKDGSPIFTGKSHRTKYCGVHGYFDKNAGYGDPSPKNL